jgi:signal transduction histidine kinase/HD-GYP domain-containing protein (c-di-GMP phosphodiesterase class II)
VLPQIAHIARLLKRGAPGAPAPAADAPAAGRALEPAVGRLSRIGAMMLDDAPTREILAAVIDAVAEETGAELVILRTAKPGGDLFEIRGYRRPDAAAEPASADSVDLARLRALERNAEPCEAGLMLSAEALDGAAGSPVPAGVDWRGRSVCIVEVGGEDRPVGFFTIGFFDAPPDERTASILRLYADRVLLLVQGDRWREQLRERERSLSLCREELASVNQLKSNFLSVVSHELRTPLTSIKAYTETLLDNVDTIKPETLKDFLTVMNEENERLIKLVDNMLSYSRLETGNLKVEKSSCNLKLLVEQVHGSLRGVFLARGINTELRLPRHPCRIEADRELIRQLLQNLMSNAAKFTPNGGKVTITLEEEAAAARIIVQDTGAGIPEGQLEKIFERFHQADASDTREHGGSGLGLAICKNIVEWHDGKIWVENVKDSGAKFIVLLPIKDVVIRQATSAGIIGSRRFERERYLSLLVETLAEFLQARKASIMLLDKDQQILRIVAAKGLDADFVENTRLEVGERIAGKVALTGEALHVFDIENEIEYGRANNALFYGTRSFISAPLREGDAIVGVLNVSDHVEGREFTKADRELLESLGGIIAGMLKKLEAYEKVSTNFERLKDAMRAILDMREAWGSRNIMNLALLALAVGRRLGLDERSLTALRLGMNLYDLGLMHVPRSIRAKREELTAKERERLREHTNVGYTLASPMGLEDRIMRMVRSHHEHFDGTGYPDGLAGDEIPVESRIVSVVDAFRALLSEGPYRRTYSLEEARGEIVKGSGTRFDPRVVAAFIQACEALEVRADRSEIVLGAFERELERERFERKRKETTSLQESTKEGAS